MTGDAARIKRELLTWPGVSAHPHRFGGTEYRHGRKEMGHIHGDHLVDLPLPRRLRDEVIAAGKAESHHVLPETGWVSCRLDTPGAVEGVLGLFRLQYDRYARAAADQPK